MLRYVENILQLMDNISSSTNDKSWISPYVSCFISCLQSCTNQYSHLFSPVEKQIIELIVKELNHDTMLLFSKLIMKKYEYFRTTNMYRTFNNRYYNLMTYQDKTSMKSNTNMNSNMDIDTNQRGIVENVTDNELPPIKPELTPADVEFNYSEYDDVSTRKLKVLIRNHLIESFDSRDGIDTAVPDIAGIFTHNDENIDNIKCLHSYVEHYNSILGLGGSASGGDPEPDPLWKVIAHNLSLPELKSLLKLMNFNNISGSR